MKNTTSKKGKYRLAEKKSLPKPKITQYRYCSWACEDSSRSGLVFSSEKRTSLVKICGNHLLNFLDSDAGQKRFVLSIVYENQKGEKRIADSVRLNAEQLREACIDYNRISTDVISASFREVIPSKHLKILEDRKA